MSSLDKFPKSSSLFLTFFVFLLPIWKPDLLEHPPLLDVANEWLSFFELDYLDDLLLEESDDKFEDSSSSLLQIFNGLMLAKVLILIPTLVSPPFLGSKFIDFLDIETFEDKEMLSPLA